MLGFLPFVGHLTEVPADFGNRVTCSDAAHLSVNGPFLSDNNWLTYERRCHVSSSVKQDSVFAARRISGWTSQELTVDKHVKIAFGGVILIIGREFINSSLGAEDPHESKLAEVPDQANNKSNDALRMHYTVPPTYLYLWRWTVITCSVVFNSCLPLWDQDQELGAG